MKFQNQSNLRKNKADTISYAPLHIFQSITIQHGGQYCLAVLLLVEKDSE